MGLGAGIAMGAGMVGQMGMAASTMSTAAPPPLPTAVAFHVAVGGAQTGPFDMSALQAQATGGKLTRDSLVWKTGMAQWAKAGEVAELSALFTSVPPPVPPGA
jgi:hypothetical protein